MITDPISGDIPTTGEVARGVTLPSTILAYSESRYKTSSIDDEIYKQGAALWCNSRKEVIDRELKDWQIGSLRKCN